ncbi:MAG: hypothetical protein GIX03_00665, partial [Candidatus Eremiobacteraeota bacterium]|nr:hypothetical protein [Candidatus Eremiobacteraeota bacterium]
MVNEIAQRSIAVVKMRLPYTDRRSLSQAWFSALHLAEERPRSGCCSGRPGPPLQPERPPTVQRGTSAAPRSGEAANGGRDGSVVRRAFVAGSEAVQQRGRVERARVAVRASFERSRSYPPFQSSLTVGVGGARVQLVLRRDGETLHVVALCAPRNAELV